eukprot:CAMPEP_0171248878 /NCGR_PEP_ID=MMETSP0790-20130122/49250_1 /TAXON_ID=2925 /ORGANISM="Alexandrium catenella, Strain OF101" /LENGTH=62 /DNA_ID=CAMNT_0011716357 /DNA_START=66 /DNA_END=251 /DNA_ORIENTATION=-
MDFTCSVDAVAANRPGASPLLRHEALQRNTCLRLEVMLGGREELESDCFSGRAMQAAMAAPP